MKQAVLRQTALKQPADQKLSLFSLTWPIFIEVSLYMFMGNADTLMLSQYSDNSVAAVGVSNQILNLIIVMFSFIATGTTIIISQFLGSKQKKEAIEVAYVSIGANFVISLVISAAVFMAAVPMLNMMGLTNDLMPDAKIFLQVVGGLSFIQALIMTFSAILKSYGYTKDTMFVTIGMNVLNIAGNFLVIFGPFGLPVLGVAGVAMSTSIARVIGLIAMIVIVNKRINLTLTLKKVFHVHKEHLRKLLKIGIPSAGEQLSYNISQMVITYFIAIMGAQALTTKVYTQNITMFILLFGTAISQGTQILIGRYIGAKQFDNAYDRCMKSLYWALGIAAGTSVIMSLFSKQLIGIFSQNPDIIATASMLIVMTIILEPGRSFNVIIINSLRAAGDAKFPVYMAMISMWGIGLPLAYLFGIHLGFGLAGVWISFIADEWIRGILMYRRWRSRIWIQKGMA
ncbi:MATE family efflux transporter [Bacillus atrophaeus]|uniref:MATE family efflux transporter n=1 Tax=Bacillus atrophaeus TaxID=1452 RepID=UPI002DB954BA|nr:MATE family efflux transporter [Bacillus atrophaeus]MEC0767797.1 MATE family efflux transporter [Bacillus atrophaeus]MEC0779141.1 MATE family efflux transporter [Bacillus atrophaeus]MEC0809532.1 MATE family efflux transporter [Bacillus atrophaeus]